MIRQVAFDRLHRDIQSVLIQDGSSNLGPGHSLSGWDLAEFGEGVFYSVLCPQGQGNTRDEQDHGGVKEEWKHGANLLRKTEKT